MFKKILSMIMIVVLWTVSLPAVLFTAIAEDAQGIEITIPAYEMQEMEIVDAFSDDESPEDMFIEVNPTPVPETPEPAAETPVPEINELDPLPTIEADTSAAEPFESPAPEVTPEASPEATAEPTVEPTIEPTAIPTPEPTPEVTTSPEEIILAESLQGLLASELPDYIHEDANGIRWQYGTNEEFAVIVGHGTVSGALNIPATLGGAPVTQISGYAFNDCNMTSVTIPASVTRIGDYAFSECTKLSTVTFYGAPAISTKGHTSFLDCSSIRTVNVYGEKCPVFSDCFNDATGTIDFNLSSDITFISASTFKNCSVIGSIEIPEGVTEIGYYAFQNSSLTSVSLPESLTKIFPDAFMQTDLISVVLPDAVTELPDRAFYGCELLRTVTFGADLETIGTLAFSGCTSLQSFTLPENVKYINDRAFQGCKTLTELSFHAGISRIHTKAFENCTNLIKLTFNGAPTISKGSSASFKGCTALEYVEVINEVPSFGDCFNDAAQMIQFYIHNGIENISYSAFEGCKVIEHINLPDSITWIAREAFLNSSLKSIRFSENLGTIEGNAFQNTLLEEITLPDSLITIKGDNAFAGCKQLHTVHFGQGLETIGQLAFSGCTALYDFVLPESLKYIERLAFGNCTAIINLTIPAGVKNIRAQAFKGCTNMKELTFMGSPSFGNKGDSSFMACTGLEVVHLPVVVPAFYNCFQDVGHAVEFRIGVGVTSIPWNAFDGCEVLYSLSMPDSITSIGRYAFRNSKLEQIRLSENLTNLGAASFFGTPIPEVELPDSLATIESEMFKNCAQLEKVHLGAATKKIDSQAFYSCAALRTLELPEGLTDIGVNAFTYSGLVKITFPASIYTIDEYAFSACSYLQEITFNGAPRNISRKKKYAAFKNCTALQTVNLNGGIPSFEQCFEGIDHAIQFNVNDGGIVVPQHAFYYCRPLETLELPEGITTIYNSAFASSNLNRIVIPESVSYIGAAPFAGCENVLLIVVPDSYAEQWAEENGFSYAYATQTSLIVRLPEEMDSARLDGLTLRLSDGKTALDQHISGDARVFSFNALDSLKNYTLSLVDAYGGVHAQLALDALASGENEVFLNDFAETVSYEIALLDEQGNDRAADAGVYWLDEEGELLETGAALNDVVSSMAVNYRISLPKALAMQYANPAAMMQPAQPGRTELQLAPLEHAALSGCIVDSESGKPLSGATVRFVQSLSDDFSATAIVSSDADGVFVLDCYAVAGELEVRLDGYSILHMTLDAAGELGEVALTPAQSASIDVKASYTFAAGSDELAPFLPEYTPDANNTAYKAWNLTTGEEVKDMLIGHGSVKLLADFNPGEEVRLVISSLNNAFADAETTLTLDEENHAVAQFDLVQPGSFTLKLFGSGNAENLALVFDQAGKLYKSLHFTDLETDGGILPEGEYTMAVLGDHERLRSAESMDMLRAFGLNEGADYLTASFRIANGTITNVELDFLPHMDEEKLSYFVADETAVTISKPSTATGSHIALRLAGRFQDRYADARNARWIIRMPEGIQLAKNTVNTQFVQNGNELVIYPASLDSITRLCLAAGVPGTYTVTAYIEFELNGSTLIQPVGSVDLTFTDMSLKVPAYTGDPIIRASGDAGSLADVTLYCNGKIMGQTQARRDGSWNITFELEDPGTVSKHEVYVVTRSQTGIIARSQKKTISYQIDMISPSRVTMLYNNKSIVFDFKNPPKEAQNYTYVTGRTFTFKIEFDGDPTRVSNVWLTVFTSNGGSRQLEAYYDASSGMWVASDQFGSHAAPINVGVSYNQDGANIVVNLKQLENERTEAEDFAAQIETLSKELENMEEVEIPEIKELTEDERKMLSQLMADDPILPEEDAELAALLEEARAIGIEFGSGFFNADGSINLLYESNTLEEIARLDAEYEALTASMQESMGEYSFEMEGADSFIAALPSGEQYFLQDTKLTKTEKELLDQGFTYHNSTGEAPVMIRYDIASGSMSIADFNNGTLTSFEAAVSPALYSARSGGVAELQNKYQQAVNSIEKLLTKISDVGNWVEATIDYWEIKIPKIEHEIYRLNINAKLYQKYHRKLDVTNWQKSWCKDKALEYYARAALLQKQVDLFKIIRPLMDSVSRYLAGLSAFLGGWQIGGALNSILELIGLYNKLDECPDGKDDALHNSILDCGRGYAAYVLGKAATIAIDIGTTTSAITLVTSGAGAPAALGPLLLKLASMCGSWALDNLGLTRLDAMKEALRAEVDAFKCNDPKPSKPTIYYDSSNPNAKPIIDPSGYVYEAVASNRISGVKATCLEKRTEYDIYDEPYTVVSIWDAAEYGQINPLITDENGCYAWDVPEGLWRVRFEKEGYQTAYSEWLVVPPPQLDVNIGIVSYKAPAVSDVRVYNDEVLFTFDRYMDVNSVTGENVIISVNGSTVSGSLAALNAEASPENAKNIYASKFSFVPYSGFNTGEKVNIHVGTGVRSYAGVAMKAAYAQDFSVAAKPAELHAPETLEFRVGEMAVLDISAAPAEAVAGKRLELVSGESILLSNVPQEVVLDENGCASLRLSAFYPGEETLEYRMEGTELTAHIRVVISQPIAPITTAAKPIASHANGATLHCGTAVELYTATAGATIYYTLDGSCPCDEATRIEYTGPIVIDRKCTLLAVSNAPGLEESGVAKFTYMVEYDPTESFSLDARGSKLAVGASMPMIAKLQPATACPVFNWSSSAESIASVDANGVVTGKKAGKAVISAVTTDGSNISAEFAITVGNYVREIAITGAGEIASGKTATLKAKAAPSSAKTKTVTWTSSDASIAKVSSKGVVTAAKGITEPTQAIITATAKDGSGVWAEHAIWIRPITTSLVLMHDGQDAGKTATIDAASEEKTIQLCAAILPENASQAVTWKSSDKKIATVDANGLVTAIKPGKATITATAKDGSKKTDSISITVKRLVKEIAVTGATEIASGKTATLKAVVTPSNATTKSVTWTSSDTSIAKVNSKGVVTAAKDITEPAQVIIAATAKDGSCVHAEHIIRVVPMASSVVLMRDGQDAGKTAVIDAASEAKTIQLSAAVYPEKASQAVTWKSSNKKIATVDATGLVTAVKPGKVTITATAKDGSKKTDAITINIVRLVKALTITGAAEIASGKTASLKAVVAPSNATTKSVSWTSSDTSIAKVSSKGVVTAAKGIAAPAQVTITATAKDGSGVQASIQMMVYPITTKVLLMHNGASVSKLNASLADKTLQLEAQSLPGNALNAYTWKSSNAKCAKVDASGNVQLLKKGTAKITATAKDGSGKTASVSITVN